MSDTSNPILPTGFESAAERYIRENPWALAGTDEAHPFIGYLDASGNILELDVALDIVDALTDGDDPEPVSLADIYTRVATADFWQEEIDDQDENSDQPSYRIL